MSNNNIYPVYNNSEDKKILLSNSQKSASGQKWYKEKIDSFYKKRNYLAPYEDGSFLYNNSKTAPKFDRTLNMKVNYDLLNNKLNPAELQRACRNKVTVLERSNKDFSDDIENMDIVSNKIKVIVGLEMKRPLDMRVIAVNPDATTRKEQKKADMIKEFVHNTIMAPIEQDIRIRSEEKSKGRELTEEERAQIEAQVQEELKAKTPDEVLEYMEREHQDPAEIQAVQLLEYLKYRTKAKEKFNEGCKQAAVVAHEAYCISEHRGHPDFRVITDFTRATYDDSPEVYFFEDGEYFSYEYLWTPSQIISFFGDDLTRKEIEEIMNSSFTYNSQQGMNYFYTDPNSPTTNKEGVISVFHATWKDFRELSILHYRDEDDPEGEIKKKVVDEDYKINPEIGDIIIYKEFFPESYEGYLINGKIYKKMRPVPGQYRDINNLFVCKLPYYGAKYDNTNSTPTSFMDRGKPYLYYNNIVHHRLKKLMASDKGKKIAINYKAIPDTEDMSMEDFFINSEESPYMLLDPTEEGNTYNDLNTSIKLVDMSLISDINNYYNISERLKADCAEAMGVSRQLEGQIEPRDGMGNTKQALVNNSYLLEPFFNMHSLIKRNVLEALLELAKVTYEHFDGETISYVLDDMSVKTFKFDYNLLKLSTLGLFITNDSKPFEVKDTIVQLAHAAMQNGTTDFSDIITILEEESLGNAKAKLKKAEKKKMQQAQEAQQREHANAKELEKIKAGAQAKLHENAKELIILKEKEQRKTKVVEASLMGASFNPELDKDNDGLNDFVELARDGLKTQIEGRKQTLEEKKFIHQREVDKQKLEIEREKAKKSNTSSK